MLIETERLTHIYSPGTPWECWALEGITLSWKPGSFVLIAGPSGSGKSTLIQHFNGLLLPSSGRVLIDGEELGSDKAALGRIRRRLGLVFQIPEQQFFAETVFDEVAFAAANLGLSSAEVARRVKVSLERVGLDYEQFRGRSPFNLSAGQQRLVAIASLLPLELEALILDEPAAGLDSGGRRQLALLLADLRRQGMTVIVVSHHLGDFISLADQILFLERGRVVAAGEVEGVLRRLAQGYEPYLPPVTDIMRRLVLRGAGVSTAVFELAAAREEIVSWWGGNSG
ncbi:MAG: ATP-binding cassette domain-containing protein [Firmicutes bacterium]|nr:ATP-binding cassette domain-containing protein [Bacillota bacterium]